MTLRFPAPWVLVLIGLILNVMAILMSSVVLDRLGARIEMLSQEETQNVYSIQLAWKTVEALERKRESLLLHIQLSENSEASDELQSVLRTQLSYWVADEVPSFIKANLPSLMTLINQAQQNSRDQIDDHYLRNLTLMDEMNSLKDKIAWYKNIGLFLQVFGLALILARDLAKR
ncbi:DNA mismatch repair protein [Vibrio lamellibrachiae]|uniref:DNA mismatch repair protein n=1 Tax=Vibrio lamellibrachiae TaxID=2910253 RepID=UPI003D149740